MAWPDPPASGKNRSVKTVPGRSARVFHLAWPLLLAALSLGACKRDIGDACKNSLDCSQETERLCDISQPGGYCTIEGCDERTCPEKSVCVRYFPHDEKAPTMSCADCTAAEVCLQDGHCVARASERRFCVHSCNDNSDCRGGYECRQVGTSGTMQLHPDPNAVVHYCAPAS
jgi:hypothetical protein